MNAVDIRSTAAGLPHAWHSLPLGQVGKATVKVLRMDGRPMATETHDTPEALMVIDGTLHLRADDIEVDVHAGQMYLVEAGIAHAVRPGSHGTLVIVDIGGHPPTRPETTTGHPEHSCAP
ncbi:cupin domain-containing protein [Streptomyces sp. NPDC039016]|uniref:cupin domain-containing protein n=1 Tax=unclassified Streptomyces TaxID=2593676 RepID=UPI000C26E0C9|nr:cupin domain-containing protein [Streptomyces sp. CB02959]PJN33476.1 cupin [Streptomyces sp. CB02959]